MTNRGKAFRRDDKHEQALPVGDGKQEEAHPVAVVNTSRLSREAICALHVITRLMIPTHSKSSECVWHLLDGRGEDGRHYIDALEMFIYERGKLLGSLKSVCRFFVDLAEISTSEHLLSSSFLADAVE